MTERKVSEATKATVDSLRADMTTEHCQMIIATRQLVLLDLMLQALERIEKHQKSGSLS